MNWRSLLQISITAAGGIQVTVGITLVVGAVVLITAYCIFRFLILRKWFKFEVVETELSLGGIGTVKIRPSYQDMQVAHRAWVELVTRKAALLFDEDNDVIVEVYNSWYQLFGRMRELVKEIPAQRLRRSPDTRELVRLLVDALNKGLRPHLTRWQARFRRWYEAQLSAGEGGDPQAIQRKFPDYDALASDLKKINKQLLEYSDLLRKIAHG